MCCRCCREVEGAEVETVSDRRVLEYEGDIYIRPLHRGVVLEGDGERYLTWIVEKLVGDVYSLSSGWHGKGRIVIELEVVEGGEQSGGS